MIEFQKEQVFIVTGASSGLGKTTALLLNELGATVVAIARNKERLQGVKNSCKFSENMHIEVKDLTEDIEELPQYVKKLKEKYGKFSGMAYCAGIGMLTPIHMLEYEDLQKIFHTNYFVPMMLTKGIVDKRNNIGAGTSLVYISSIDALAATKGQCAYSGSKAALFTSIKALAKEVCRFGIRANCVSPSAIKTSMTINDTQELYNISEEKQADKYPFGWGEPEDVANMIVFLLSDRAKFISGQNYIIDSGGML